jgi:hypothetical protein
VEVARANGGGAISGKIAVNMSAGASEVLRGARYRPMAIPVTFLQYPIDIQERLSD